jgi:hypothetical protein
LHDYALCSLFSATPTCILPSRKIWLVDSCFVTSSWCYISGDIALLFKKCINTNLITVKYYKQILYNIIIIMRNDILTYFSYTIHTQEHICNIIPLHLFFFLWFLSIV